MRAHETGWMFEMFIMAAHAFVLPRRRSIGEQTGGRRFGLLRYDASERARRGCVMPSERGGGRGPPGLSSGRG
ncbi:MAG: hypothetical protein R3B57_11470 [Phycisphaerales bacterium]